MKIDKTHYLSGTEMKAVDISADSHGLVARAKDKPEMKFGWPRSNGEISSRMSQYNDAEGGAIESAVRAAVSSACAGQRKVEIYDENGGGWFVYDLR